MYEPKERHGNPMNPTDESANPVQGLRSLVLRKIYRELERQRPRYVTQIRVIRDREPASSIELRTLLDVAYSQYGGPPIEPWSALVVDLEDYQVKLDAVRFLNQRIQSSDEPRELNHYRYFLYVALFAAVQTVVELVKKLERRGLIDTDCAADLADRARELLDDGGVQIGRNQVAHPAGHVGDSAWLRAITSNGYLEAAAVGETIGRTFFEAGPIVIRKMGPADIDEWRQQSAHGFWVLRVISTDILRNALECALRLEQATESHPAD